MRPPLRHALALAILALALPPPAADADPITAERPFALITERGDATSWRLLPGAAGVITAEATWRGADSLALILNGPGQTGNFARQDGPSPLVLRFRLTPELLRREGEWRLSLVNFSGQRARGDVRITWPGEAAATQSGAAGVAVPQRVAGRATVPRGVEGRATVPRGVEGRVDPGMAIRPTTATPPAPPGLEPPPSTSGDIRRTVLPDGRVRLDFADGSARIYNVGCGWTNIASDGHPAGGVACNEVQGASLPPPPGDPAFSGFLGTHEERLLLQITFLVGDDAQAVASYLALESGETASVVERIDLRRRYVDRLLGIGF